MNGSNLVPVPAAIHFLAKIEQVVFILAYSYSKEENLTVFVFICQAYPINGSVGNPLVRRVYLYHDKDIV